MHTFSETGTGVPAFLAKLWRLVEDAETNDLISWSTDGRSFIIQNQAQFAKELLPLNYKHNNMASFIRQLNMYGFHKITSIDNGGLRFDRDEMEFTHPCFQKDHPYLLEHIKRKIATSKQQQLQAQQAADDKSALKLEAVSRVLSEVKNMRGRQDSLDSRFQAMKQENEALWREVAILRQKHHKQQQIVNKLIQFLVTIVQPSRGGLGSMGNGNNKRRFQLMINDAPQQAKLKKSDYSDGGATIEELGEALEEVAYANQQELLAEYGQHIDTVQTDLESLKELLKGEGYQLDANALLGNACSAVPTYGRVYFPSGPFDPDTINKVRTDLFHNNEDMLGYDFPMNLPDLMSDDQQLQQQQQSLQHLTQSSLQQQQQTQQQLQHLGGGSSGGSDKSASSSSPTPGGGQMSPVSPVPSAHTQLMAFKLGGHNGGGAGNVGGAGMNNGFFGPGIHDGAGGIAGNGNMAGLLGGGTMMGPSGSLGIVSGDYIDLNELLSMDGNGGHDEDNASMMA